MPLFPDSLQIAPWLSPISIAADSHNVRISQVAFGTLFLNLFKKRYCMGITSSPKMTCGGSAYSATPTANLKLIALVFMTCAAQKAYFNLRMFALNALLVWESIDCKKCVVLTGDWMTSMPYVLLSSSHFTPFLERCSSIVRAMLCSCVSFPQISFEIMYKHEKDIRRHGSFPRLCDNSIAGEPS